MTARNTDVLTAIEGMDDAFTAFQARYEEKLAAKDCLLVMWATAPMLHQALELMDRWEFEFKTCGAWAKQ